ncbi:MAG: methyltransferase domain-containing protein [Pyrinomonadaceae bacterium]
MSKAKDIWEDYAANDAYFAVSTFDKFRSSNIDDVAKAEFFETGHQHVDEVWSELETAFGVELRPKRAIDYGCGVGRILLPLAKKCDLATGVDISSAMLKETRCNAAAMATENIRLQSAEEFFAADADTYDLVHSYIVLQHIDPSIGYRIIGKMLTRLVPGGFGMLHVTFKDPSSSFQRFRFKIYRDVPCIHRFMNIVRGIKERLMPMYEYDRERVMDILGQHSCEMKYVRETDHGFLGAMMFFRKATNSK